ncbi:MAG: hypothetical protein RL417_1074 [Pseudomonadota bacterium]|jgi:hypothetical protein
MNLRINVVLATLLAVLCSTEFAFAGPSQKSVSNEAKAIDRSMKKLVRKLNKLSLKSRAQVMAALSKLADADSDGVPDVLETSGARCDSDFDDDGLNDGDEYKNRTNPNDRDSDDDGVADGDDDSGRSGAFEIEVKGLLRAKSSSQITVGTTTFVINGSTKYRRGGQRSGLSIEDFELQECLEVEGERRGAENTAFEVKTDNDCI